MKNYRDMPKAKYALETIRQTILEECMGDYEQARRLLRMIDIHQVKVESHWYSNKVKVIIMCDRPGVLIGHHGKIVNFLKRYLSNGLKVYSDDLLSIDIISSDLNEYLTPIDYSDFSLDDDLMC